MSWDKTTALGSTYQQDDESITHHIIDRPLVGKTHINRVYVQPQWIFDCINENMLLPVDEYLPGAVLPPHLSPFVETSDSGYLPPEKQRLINLKLGIVDEKETVKAVEEEEESKSDDKKNSQMSDKKQNGKAKEKTKENGNENSKKRKLDEAKEDKNNKKSKKVDDKKATKEESDDQEEDSDSDEEEIINDMKVDLDSPDEDDEDEEEQEESEPSEDEEEKKKIELRFVLSSCFILKQVT